MSSKQFATIIVITFIVGIIWLIADILRNTKASVPDNPQLNTLLEPINPNFNARTLQIIDEEVPSTDSIPITRGSSTPTVTTPTATQAGQLIQ